MQLEGITPFQCNSFAMGEICNLIKSWVSEAAANNATARAMEKALKNVYNPKIFLHNSGDCHISTPQRSTLPVCSRKTTLKVERNPSPPLWIHRQSLAALKSKPKVFALTYAEVVLLGITLAEVDIVEEGATAAGTFLPLTDGSVSAYEKFGVEF